jgi:hypothetical protein
MKRSWRDQYRKCHACKREYRPKRQAQSYCSPHCKRAAAYGRERFAAGTTGRRRRRLEASDKAPRNGVFSSIETIPCKPRKSISSTPFTEWPRCKVFGRWKMLPQGYLPRHLFCLAETHRAMASSLDQLRRHKPTNRIGERLKEWELPRPRPNSTIGYISQMKMKPKPGEPPFWLANKVRSTMSKVIRVRGLLRKARTLKEELRLARELKQAQIECGYAQHWVMLT